MPQINITLLRLFQGRNLLHRMVGRTVAIGDIPWVAQSAEAFLSKVCTSHFFYRSVNVALRALPKKRNFRPRSKYIPVNFYFIF